MPSSSAVTAILHEKCPRCRRGNMFTHSPINLGKFDNMYENCPVCHFRYEVELGFYWGAMYISYGISVIIVVLVAVLLYYLAHNPPLWVYGVSVGTATLVFTTFLFRYARVIMLYLFGSVHYDPKYDKSV